MATGNNGGRRGKRRGGFPPPAACSSATVHGTAARSPAFAPARGARPTRPSGPNGRHALMTTATRRNPRPPPRFESLPTLHPATPRFSTPTLSLPRHRQRCAASRPRLDSTVKCKRPPRTCRPPSANAAANARDGRARAPPALGACGGCTRASDGRRARPCADCGKLPARVRTAAVAAAARGAPQHGASRQRYVCGDGGVSTVRRPPPRGGRPSAAS